LEKVSFQQEEEHILNFVQFIQESQYSPQEIVISNEQGVYLSLSKWEEISHAEDIRRQIKEAQQ
jgi:hypothetical protein